LKIKKIIKSNLFLYNLLINSRDKLRIIYNQKRRSRFFWNLRDGDNKLSFNYPLSEESIFFDVGGHLGNFSKKIIEKFDCKVYIFEPVEENFKILKNNLKQNEKVKFYEAALLDFDGESYISDLGASSSLYNREEGETGNKVIVKSFNTIVEEENLNSIDLVKMNIEGSEYDLLNHIIDTGNIKIIKHLQIQFHNFVDDAKENRNEIRRKLTLTHVNKFNFPFIWERWDLK
tara:strand:+ start:208 stop:900 length:693 start_codon:yes stop_codon:yes gene_type:complete